MIDGDDNAFLDRTEREPVEIPEWNGEGIEVGFQELVRVVDGDGELSCTGRDGLAVVEMMLGFLKSQVEGNVKVTLPLAR